jgi:hypothetical protein
LRIAALRGREEAAWIEVDQRIKMRTPQEYESAVQTIGDLKALFDRGESAVEFDDRFRRLRERHGKKRNLMGLLKQAGLLS